VKVWFRRTGFVLALAFLALTFVNASWLADSPRGYVKLVAQRGLMQLPGPGAAGDCPARAIEPPVHDFIENTQPAMAQALRLGAQMIAIDVAPTADGRFALFRDPALDCRTNGKGPVSAQTLAQLKALDVGYGYSPDGGQTFPLRGLGQGLIPALEEALTVAGDTPLHYNLRFADAATAGRLIAAIRVAGRNPAERGDSFTGPEAALAPIRAAWPAALAASPEQAAACTRAYLWQGWLGLTPGICRGSLIAIPLDRQWAFAGWPNRLIARMEAVGAGVVLTGEAGSDGPRGLDLPEQVGQVPAGFNGYVLVDDMWSVGPALRPAYNKRNPREQAELARALDARRAARD
jgi:glycerophosphoryl diester phosphodiesterase